MKLRKSPANIDGPNVLKNGEGNCKTPPKYFMGRKIKKGSDKSKVGRSDHRNKTLSVSRQETEQV